MNTVALMRLQNRSIQLCKDKQSHINEVAYLEHLIIDAYIISDRMPMQIKSRVCE